MRTGLLSIHEKYAKAIFEGRKQYEFRRRAPELGGPTRFLVYVPGRRRLAGEIWVEAILEGSPSSVWERTKHAGGITRREFRSYFEGRETAYALAIARAEEYAQQSSLEELRDAVPGGFYPPQYLRWLPTTALAAMRPLGIPA
jgi:predicted transcriptional regulator